MFHDEAIAVFTRGLSSSSDASGPSWVSASPLHMGRSEGGLFIEHVQDSRRVLGFRDEMLPWMSGRCEPFLAAITSWALSVADVLTFTLFTPPSVFLCLGGRY